VNRSSYRVLAIGHRGAAGVAPENTLPALHAGIVAGVHAVEFDVRRCAGGEIVLMHDADLSRTTDGEGDISKTDLTTLMTFDAGSWKGESFAGTAIPNLKEALSLCSDSGVTAVVEVKDYECEAELAAMLSDSATIAPSVVVICFDRAFLTRLARVLPEVPRYWLCDALPYSTVTENVDFLLAEALACGAAGVDLNHRVLSHSLVTALRAKHLHCWCYTVNNSDRMRELVEMNVDGITTDYPRRLLQVLGKNP
jgi:glycerophosphoryl diester phosphodiesterase